MFNAREATAATRYSALFGCAYALRLSDVDMAVELFLQAFAISGLRNIDAVVHASLALRDAGRANDARALLDAAGARDPGAQMRVAFERALIDFQTGEFAEAVNTLARVDRGHWTDEARLVEAASLAKAGRRDEALSALETIRQTTRSFVNGYFFAIYLDLMLAVMPNADLTEEYLRINGSQSDTWLVPLDNEAMVKDLAERIDVTAMLRRTMSAPPSGSDGQHSVNLWVAGFRLALGPVEERERLEAACLGYVNWLIDIGRRVHPTCLKSLLKGYSSIEFRVPKLISRLMTETTAPTDARELVVAAELVLRARQRGDNADRAQHDGKFASVFAHEIARLAPQADGTRRRVNLQNASVLVGFFGQCRDPGRTLPAMIDAWSNIGFGKTRFIMSTWAQQGHHVPPNGKILRHHLDDPLAAFVEQTLALQGVPASEIWTEPMSTERIFKAMPALGRAANETKSLEEIVEKSRIEHLVLNDERAFDQQYDAYVSSFEVGEPRRFMAEVRNQFKMWHSIARLVESIAEARLVGSDYLLLCRPDLQVRGSWIEHFPTMVDSGTAYTDIERNCLTVGLGGLGDRYVLLPIEYAATLTIPDQLRVRGGYSFDKPEQRLRLSWHQLLESILIESGVAIDVHSIKLPFGLHRRMFGLADVQGR